MKKHPGGMLGHQVVGTRPAGAVLDLGLSCPGIGSGCPAETDWGVILGKGEERGGEGNPARVAFPRLAEPLNGPNPLCLQGLQT